MTDPARLSVRPVEAEVLSPERATLRTTSRGKVVGVHASIRDVIQMIDRVARSSCTVLVTGESGTGKELAVAALHDASPRSQKPLVSVNCGAIAESLMESELFGHAKGAFTGAHAARAGWVARAEGGTLFLDEVSELSPELQARLLRAIESREVKPLGADRPVAVDVRVVVSTTRNLQRDVKDGTFRQDLYYRLAAVVVRLPPLRSRLEDVPVLVDTILDDLNRRRDAQTLPPYPGLDRRAMELLSRYEFPGNVRELRNLVERFAVLGPDAGALARQSPAADRFAGHEIRTDLPFHDAKEIWTEIFETAYLTRLLAAHHHNVSAAARTSGIDRRHLQRLMVKHDLREREPAATPAARPPGGA